MNWIDLIIVATVVLCGGLGLVTGFVWQMAGIVALFAGVFATIFIGPPAGHALERWIHNPSLARVASYVAVFSAASMGVRVLATVFSKLLERVKLKHLDRLLGGVVGVAKAILISAVLVIILGRYGTTGTRASVRQSCFGGLVITLVDYVAGKADEYDVTEKARDAWNRGKAAGSRIRQEGERLLGGRQNIRGNRENDSRQRADSGEEPAAQQAGK